MIIFKTLFKTLNKNTSSFTITDESISDNSIFEVYPSDESVILADVTVNGTTANITFDSAAEYNIPCAVFINNLVGAYEPITHLNASDVNYMLNISVKDALDNNLEGLVNQGSRISVLENKLPSGAVPGDVLYHGNTGNIWKKLDASNLDYDNDSTIYSAMGNVDELETESNNLVDAINEVNAKPSGGAIAYSTTEFDTGKTWIDGKKIYCKVLTGTSLSAGNNNFNVRELQIDVPTNIFMNVKVTLSGNTRWRPVPFSYWLNGSNADWYGGVFYNYPEDTINAQLGPSLINGVNNWFIIVEYTKRS